MPSPEVCCAEELTWLTEKKGLWSLGWLLTLQAVVAFVYSNDRSKINRKFVGDVSLVERYVIALADERALLLVGGPGTTKLMLPGLLSAAICGTSSLTVQGNTGTTKDQLRYDRDYAQLLVKGPDEGALVNSLVLAAMRTGWVARVEKIIRCLPEAQDTLALVPSERRLVIPELGEYAVHTTPGLYVIVTANLRDRGVSEMSAALEHRFNFEAAEPTTDTDAEITLMTGRTRQVLTAVGVRSKVGEMMVEILVTAFRELHSGVSQEDWAMEEPLTVLSITKAVAISDSIALARAFFPHAYDGVRLIPG